MRCYVIMSDIGGERRCPFAAKWRGLLDGKEALSCDAHALRLKGRKELEQAGAVRALAKRDGERKWKK